MMGRHLSEDRLIALTVGDEWASADEAHLSACEACRARRASLVALLDEVDHAAVIEADAAFTNERLARQHSRILHRLAADGRPGKLISFPAASNGSHGAASWRPTSRWIAAAALVGLFVGVLADQVLTRLPGPTRPIDHARSAPATNASRAVIQPVAASLSDDEFLGQLEAAVQSGGPIMLHPLDAATPLAWDISR